MPHHSSSDDGLTSSWWTHCREDYQVLEIYPFEVFPVVPALLAEVLPQDLDRRLCSVLLLLRHVKIIHENDAFLSYWGSVDTLPSLLHFGVDGVLRLVGAGLSRESNSNVLVVLAHLIGEQLEGVLGLSSTSGAWAQHVHLVLKQQLHQVEVPSRIGGRDHDIRIEGILLHLEFFDCLLPNDVVPLIDVEEVVVDQVLLRQINGLLLL